MPGMSWDAEADRKLLLGILVLQNVKVDHEAMAKMFTTSDVTCTPKAVKERLLRLKKLAKEQGFDPATGGADKSGPATPVKVKTTPKKKKQASDDDDEKETPKKKKKTTGKAAKNEVLKQEPDPEEDDAYFGV